MNEIRRSNQDMKIEIELVKKIQIKIILKNKTSHI